MWTLLASGRAQLDSRHSSCESTVVAISESMGSSHHELLNRLASCVSLRLPYDAPRDYLLVGEVSLMCGTSSASPMAGLRVTVLFPATTKYFTWARYTQVSCRTPPLGPGLAPKPFISGF